MTTDVQVAHPNTTVMEAAQIMRDRNIGALPVCDGDNLLGMLTDRDIVVRAVADNRPPDDTLAVEMMTPGIMYCYDDDKMDDVTRIMAKQQIRRLPVLNREKYLVGILSLGDVAVEGDSMVQAGKTLEKISELPRSG